MNTYLGASGLLGPGHVNPDVIKNAAITYLEGYMFDTDPSKAAFRTCADMAHAAGRKLALSLSDPFCVERHRDDFLAFLKNGADILFANEAELKSLYQTDDFDAAIAAVRKDCTLAAITRSEKGSVIVTVDQAIEIAAEPVAKVVDTTGAGDQYAAGFLYGYARGMDLGACGTLASKAAAEVISHLGPRPQMRYAEFLKQAA
jgi:sugar/nucleoside kinase (ribokinase family)